MAKDNFGLVCLEFVVWFTRTQVSWFLGQRYFLKAGPKPGIFFAKKYFANARKPRALVHYLHQRIPCCVFFIQTCPTRHIVLCLG